jgi:hypothetical protein
VRRIAIGLAVVAFVAAACGEPSIPRGAAGGLQRRVANIRSAVEAGEVELAEGRLTALARRVGRLLERGVIDDAAAIEILDAIEAVGAALPLASTGTDEPAVTPTASPSPPDLPGEEGGGNEEGKKEGHGKNEGHGDEGHGNDE